jgi:hypothetical protein
MMVLMMMDDSGMGQASAYGAPSHLVGASSAAFDSKSSEGLGSSLLRCFTSCAGFGGERD